MAQLVQKKTALQFKTVDQTLQTHDKDGAKQALSYRCADIDKLIPNLMGVSKVPHTVPALYVLVKSLRIASPS